MKILQMRPYKTHISVKENFLMALRDLDILLRQNHDNSPLCIYSSFQGIEQQETINRDRKESETESL